MGLESWISCYEVDNCNETEIAYFRKDYELHNFFYKYFVSVKDKLKLSIPFGDPIDDPFNGYLLEINKDVVKDCIDYLIEISENQETDEYEYSIDKLYNVLKFIDKNPNKKIYYNCSY